MSSQDQTPVSLGVKGRNDVGEGLVPIRCPVCEGVFCDGPARAVQLTQPRQDVLGESGCGRDKEGVAGGTS